MIQNRRRDRPSGTKRLLTKTLDLWIRKKLNESNAFSSEIKLLEWFSDKIVKA